MSSPLRKPSEDVEAKKQLVRTHTPRPDELSHETFEFISAVDQYKRRHLRSFLDDEEILAILHELGYRRESATGAQVQLAEELADLASARLHYRVEKGRLFPTWSEVFELLLALGYHREERPSAA